jgi:hypothetical protein
VKRQVKHGNKGLLDSGLPIAVHQGFTETSGGDSLEDDGEKLWVELAHVTKSNGGRNSDALVPLDIRLLVSLLLIDIWLIHLHHEYSEDSLDSFMICKSMSR